MSWLLLAPSFAALILLCLFLWWFDRATAPRTHHDHLLSGHPRRRRRPR